MIESIRKHLGDQESLLDYTCTGIAKDQLHLPGPDFVDRVVAQTDRSPQVMGSLQLSVTMTEKSSESKHMYQWLGGQRQ